MSQKNTKTSISKKSKKNYDEFRVYDGQHTAKAEFVGNTNKARIKILDQTCLDRLLMYDSISLENYRIMDRLYADYCKSGFVGVRASNYNPRIEATHEGLSEKHMMLKRKVMDCFNYIKDTGNKTAYKIFKKLYTMKKSRNGKMNGLLWMGTLILYAITWKSFINFGEIVD